jgi:hypothetical protein
MIIVNSVKSLAVKGLNLQEQKVLKEFQSFSFAAKMTCKKLCNEWRLFQTLYFLSWLDRKLLIIMNKLADRGTPTVLVYCLNKSEMHTGWTSMGRVCEGFANFWRGSWDCENFCGVYIISWPQELLWNTLFVFFSHLWFLKWFFKS